MSKDIVIHVSDLTKFYGEMLAVDHVDFEVKREEICGYLGLNSTGKTTTIRTLTLFLIFFLSPAIKLLDKKFE